MVLVYVSNARVCQPLVTICVHFNRNGVSVRVRVHVYVYVYVYVTVTVFVIMIEFFCVSVCLFCVYTCICVHFLPQRTVVVPIFSGWG